MKPAFSAMAGEKMQFLRRAQSAGYLIIFLCFRLSDASLWSRTSRGEWPGS
jgi:hypothetical protein